MRGRGLCHQQLPELAHHQQLLMQDFNDLEAAKDVQDLTERMREMQCITSKYIAIAVGNCKLYRDFVQLVETQLMDPLASLARGNKQPGICGFNSDSGDEGWTRDRVEGGLYAVGY